MDNREHSDTLIDLGAASVETQGLPEKQNDLGFQGIPVGMSDED
ncbi:MAG: benenodin family lasso peptide [Sphingomonas sp.]